MEQTYESYGVSTRHFSTNPEDAGRIKSNGQTWQLQNMWEHHHVMKRLCVLGWSVKQIADHLKMTPEAIRGCLNSEIMRREIEILRAGLDVKAADVAKRLEDMANKSCDVLDNILEDDNAPVAIRAKVALDVLSRTGYPPHTKVTGSIDHRHLTATEIDMIKCMAKDTKQITSTEIVEAEFTDGS